MNGNKKNKAVYRVERQSKVCLKINTEEHNWLLILFLNHLPSPEKVSKKEKQLHNHNSNRSICYLEIKTIRLGHWYLHFVIKSSITRGEKRKENVIANNISYRTRLTLYIVITSLWSCENIRTKKRKPLSIYKGKRHICTSNGRQMHHILLTCNIPSIIDHKNTTEKRKCIS